ncbi:MAG TPA: hypothetical protein VE173_13995, partial [Longimicrobiales bacterium]|nr:hypothetical protein [Longimicrobiales bacterium]
YFGRDGIARRLRDHIAMARWLAERVDAEPGWERVAPVPFGTVVFRRAPEGAGPEEQDRESEAVLEAVNATGRVFLSHTRLRERFCLRLSIGNLRTTPAHVERAWNILREAAAGVAEGVRPRPGFS